MKVITADWSQHFTTLSIELLLPLNLLSFTHKILIFLNISSIYTSDVITFTTLMFIITMLFYKHQCYNFCSNHASQSQDPLFTQMFLQSNRELKERSERCHCWTVALQGGYSGESRAPQLYCLTLNGPGISPNYDELGTDTLFCFLGNCNPLRFLYNPQSHEVSPCQMIGMELLIT